MKFNSINGCREFEGASPWFILICAFIVGVAPCIGAAEPISLRGHEGWVAAVRFSPDGKRIVSGGDDGAVRVWDATSSQSVWAARDTNTAVTAVAFRADGQRVAAARWDGSVAIFDARAGKQLLELRGHKESVTSVAFSPDGRRLATGSGDDTLKLWDAESGAVLRTIEQGNEYDVTAVAFSAYGQRLASGNGENEVRIWDAESGEGLNSLEGHESAISSVEFSADGTRLLSASWDRTARVWDAGTGKALAVLRGHADEVTGTAFTADGRSIATSSADGTVRIWRATGGDAAQSISGGMGRITSVAFSPDGRRVAASGKGVSKVWTLAQAASSAPVNTAARTKPNLIVILADDVGYGDLGCFGQKLLKTPRLDTMAADGMKLTQFYAGSPVCAPSRCVLLTGRHAGRATIRGNSAKPIVLAPGQLTVASLLKGAGYATSCIGKWGVGTQSNLTNPNDVGFDHFFGYVNMMHAHNYWPEFLVRNGAVEKLRNEVPEKWKSLDAPAGPRAGAGVAEKRVDYAPDLLLADALRFIREQKDKPFFLFFTPNLPHANNEAGRDGMEVQDASEFAREDWPGSEKRFAAMMRRLDRDAGQILDTLTELNIATNTLVLFTSDNGPYSEGGHDAEFFNSNGRYRGIKLAVSEGGIRVPAIAWWPGTIAPGSTSDHQWYVGDVVATAAELAGLERPADSDSDSLVPLFRGHPPAKQWDRKSSLYWEFYEGRTAQAVRFGKWKAIRSPMFTGVIELYDLSWDSEEKRDYAPRRADLIRHAENLLKMHHHADPNWPVPHAKKSAP